MDLIRISISLASLSALVVVDPSLIIGQFFLVYPIEVFFFLCHGPFEGRVLPSGLASRSSRMDVGISVRVIRLIAYVQIDPLDIASFVAPGGRWKVLRGRLSRLAGQFRQGSDQKNPCMPVWPDRSEYRNRVFCRAGFYSWPSPLRFPHVLREWPRAFLVRPNFSERRRTFLSSGPVSRCS